MSDQDQTINKNQYDPEWVARYFDDQDLLEWERLVATPAQEVSLHVHTHYLEQYVPPGARVLEIGAGAGRFTQVLAGLNTRILVGDLSEGQLELNRTHAHEYRFEQAVEDWQVLDICEMTTFEDASFDCVVAYGGPLSYALDKRDAALQECIRVLKPESLLIASVMALWGGARDRLKGVLSLSVEDNRRVTRTGDVLPHSFPGSRHFMHMFRSQEFRSFLNTAGLNIVALSSSIALSLNQDALLEAIRNDEEKWSELLRMELEACAQDGALDLGPHMIGVARKS